jgi:Calx-beta domain
MSRIFVDDIVIDEASGNAIFTVYLDVPDVNLITVRYQTTHETTTSAEYTPKGTTALTSQPGETSKTVSTPISNDLIPEFKESFMLFLSAPVNATFAETNYAFATIIDNDA